VKHHQFTINHRRRRRRHHRIIIMWGADFLTVNLAINVLQILTN